MKHNDEEIRGAMQKSFIDNGAFLKRATFQRIQNGKASREYPATG